MKDIVVIGAGGFGREVIWLIEEINKVKKEWNIIGIVDDNPELLNKKFNNYPVVGNIEWLKSQNNIYAVCAIGEPKTKSKIMNYLSKYKINFPILIHPNVVMSSEIDIEEGSIICAGNILTVNINIGKHVIINLDCTIGHDVDIGDFCTILPSANISGGVKIKQRTTIGTNATIIQYINIGENVIIGAGAVIVKDVPDNVVVVGNPGRVIRKNE